MSITRPSRRVTALLMGLALVLVACGTADDELGGPPVPDRTFEDFDGEQVSLADYEGTPLVVNFWASWCPPCIAEMPDLEAVHQARGDEVAFVGLNTQDELTTALDLVDQTGVTYDLGQDPDGDLFRDFEVFSMPTTFFVDEDGAIVHRHSGLVTLNQLEELVDEHLTS